MFQANVVEKIITHILRSIHFLQKSSHLWDGGGKVWYSQTGHTW